MHLSAYALRACSLAALVAQMTLARPAMAAGPSGLAGPAGAAIAPPQFHAPTLLMYDAQIDFAVHETDSITYISHGTQLGRFMPQGTLDWQTDAHPGLPAAGRILRLDVLTGDLAGLYALVEPASTTPGQLKKREEYKLVAGTWTLWTPQTPRVTPGEYLGVTWEFSARAQTGHQLLRVRIPVEDDPATWTGSGRFDYRDCASKAGLRAHIILFNETARSMGEMAPTGICARAYVAEPDQMHAAWVGYDATGVVTLVDERSGPSKTYHAPTTYNGQRCMFALDKADTYEESTTQRSGPSKISIDATPHCIDARGRWYVRAQVVLTPQGTQLVPTEVSLMGGLGLSGAEPGIWTMASGRPAMIETRGAASTFQWLRDPNGAFAWPIDFIHATMSAADHGASLVLTTPTRHEPTDREVQDDLAPRGTSLFLLKQ